MFATLFTIGPFSLQTLSVFMVLSFLVSSFVFWRKGREEHYSEAQLFDGFLTSLIFGYIASRFAYLIFHFDQFGWEVWKWFDIVHLPGVLPGVGLLASTLAIARFAHSKKWDVFEILDFWVLAMSVGMVLTYIGYFFDGSLFGLPTSLPWGMVFPGVFERHHPVQLYAAIFYSILFFFLHRVEYSYRSFEWYRGGKKTAQTGFLLCVNLILHGIFALSMSFVQLPELVFGAIAIDRWVYGAEILIGIWLLLLRSGRIGNRPVRRPTLASLLEHD